VSVPGEHEEVLAAGSAALQRADWAAARACFEAVVDDAEIGEALAGLADALSWLGDLEGSLRCRERAYAEFRRRDEPAHAAMAAVMLCLDYRKQVGNPVVSAGWLARARRLIDDNGIDELRGWLAFASSFDCDDAAAAERLADEALAFARSHGDTDLELCALSQRGVALVKQGLVDEGVRSLDEAMVGSLSGEGSNLDTVVFTSCMMLTSCTDCAEFERALHSIRATVSFTERYGCPFLYAECRIYYGAVLLATGDWPHAEIELLAGLALCEGAVPTLHRLALATLAELRIGQGRIEEAERLVAGLEDQVETVVVIARIHLLRGRAEVAAASLKRRLRVIGGLRLESAQVVELLGEADLALGAPYTAHDRGTELVELGTRLGCEIVRARGERLLGRALAVLDDVDQARAHLDAALVAFARLELRYEAACTRRLLADALVASAPEVAAAEARAALTAFDELGARRDADAAAGLLRTLGVTVARGGPRGRDSLTKRENEVLALLGEGLSNPEIAARLYVSRKTVEHHVARLLAKLGLRNRAEAAAAFARNSRHTDE
jgi:DNA-binding CsgD family transcriptional regulator